MHDDQLDLSLPAARALIADQFPQWRALPVRQVPSDGTVNAIFRIGDDLTARFPLQLHDIDVVRRELLSEAAAASELAGRTRFPTPEPVVIGEPGDGYPLPWSVQTWVPGVSASASDPGDSPGFAHDLAEFIAGVRAIGTGGRTFAGGGRGGVLRTHEEWVDLSLDRSEGLVDVASLRRLWAEWRELPRGDAPDVMSHKDLIPGNVLVADGRLAGVLDVGGLGPADPALDLVGAWHLLEAGPRRLLRADLDCDDATWERGRAWAFVQAIGLIWYYVESNPAMFAMGRRTLARVLAAG
ncbi:MAG: aminoglycoside phosphotransferase family protein [Hamadaea sp.]|nr:aminoglycoside phosphotransferase family protein [Hamadaea sp.]